MPWQRHVADVALERDPDTGRLVYREIVLTVPRQSGKTTLLLAVMVHRALGFGERQRVLYTAQTRNDARRKWEDEHVAVLKQSALRSMFEVRYSNGAEAIRWNNGSIHGVSSSTEKAGHGETLDLGVIDEAFAHEDYRLEQALKPTMVTRPEPQLWIVSTAGAFKSTYLRDKVDAGRLAAEAGITKGVAYFEWSAPPDVDPADEQARYGYMPALGRTVRAEAIAADYQSMSGKLEEFRRAYMNQWPNEAPDEWQVITKADWQALTVRQNPVTAPVAFAADMTPSMSWGTIGVAWRNPDGTLRVEVGEGDHRPGTSWMVDRLVELYGRHHPCAVVVAAEGPASALIAPLLAKIPAEVLLRPNATERAAATGQFYEAVTDSRTLRHLGQANLNAAVAQARRQEVGDHWWWTRRNVFGDVSPLIAVTLAAWGHAMRAHLYDDYDLMASVH